MRSSLLVLLMATASHCDEVTASARRLRGWSTSDVKNDSQMPAESQQAQEIGDAVTMLSARKNSVTCDEPTDTQGKKQWMQDMSVTAARYYLTKLRGVQPQVPPLYKYLEGLNAFVNRTVQEMQNATGRCVTWGTHCGLGDEDEDTNSTTTEAPLEQDDSDYGSDEVWDPSALPPHATLVNNDMMYVNKEIKVLWAFLTDVDRKRSGVLNAMGSRPYGPHGRHPENWHPQGYFPCANCSGAQAASTDSGNASETEGDLDQYVLGSANLLSVAGLFLSRSGHGKVITNFYQCRLAQDYAAILQSLKGLRRKIVALRESLLISADAAKKFIASPSGVYNPCPPSICPQSTTR